MNGKKILDISFEVLIIPLFFMMTEYFEIVTLKIILSILIFYFFIGYKILQTIKNLLKFDFGKDNSAVFYLIQDLSFAFLIGIVLNVIYGIIAASFQIYSYRLFYFLFFELVLLLNLYLKNRSLSYSSEVVKNYRLSDFLKLSILLLPSLVQVLISFYYSPLPLMQGWDIFYYQGITNEFLVDRIDYNLFELSKQPPGFMFIQANIVVSSNIPAYFLIFFDKIAVILTNGFNTLWIFLICYKITKSNFASLIPSTLLSTFDGKIALGPYYVVPSSFSWQIGLVIFYFLLYKKKKFEDLRAKNTQKKMLYGYFFLILLLISLCYILHFFTFLVISFLVIIDFVLELNHFKLRRKFYSVIIISLVIFIIFNEKFNIFNQIFQFVSSIVYPFRGNQNLIWTFSQSFSFLFEDFFILISPILGLISILIILIFNRKEYDFYIFKFCLFLIIFFTPLIYIYRITYLIFVFNAILQSIAIYQIKENSSGFKKVKLKIVNNIKKSKKKILNIIQISKISSKKTKFKLLKYNIFSTFSRNRKINKNKKQFNLHDLNSIFIFLIVIFPSFILMQENFNFNNLKKIDLSNKTVYSAYSYDEYNAAVWLYENIDREIYYICADPGSNYYLYGIAGIPYLNAEVKNETYRNMFLTCGDQGLNITFLQKLEDYDYKNIILVLTPKFHKWIQTGSRIEGGIVNPDWLNYTLLEYIDISPYIRRIYYNSEVFVYSFLI